MRQIVVQMVWSSGGAGSGSPSKVTDRTLANQLGALAEDCERRAEQAAQADAVEASARKGMNSSPPKSRSSARLQAARAVRLAERTLERIEDEQPRRSSALSGKT